MIRVAILSIQAHESVSGLLVSAAEQAVVECDCSIVRTIQVKAALSSPYVIVNSDFRTGVDCGLVVGYIWAGETSHGLAKWITVCGKLIELSISERFPLGICLIGPDVSLMEVADRAELYARQAVESMVEQCLHRN